MVAKVKATKSGFTGSDSNISPEATLKDVIELYCSAKYDGVPYPKDMASYIEQVKKDLPMRQAVKRRPETQDILRI